MPWAEVVQEVVQQESFHPGTSLSRTAVSCRACGVGYAKVADAAASSPAAFSHAGTWMH